MRDEIHYFWKHMTGTSDIPDDGENPSPPAEPGGLSSGVQRLFQVSSYRFQFGMRRGGDGWFDAATSPGTILRERARWIRETPERCVVWLPEAEPALRAMVGMVQNLPESVRRMRSDAALCGALAAHWEPDFLLLQRMDDGDHRLVGGCVCFPSSWSVSEKLGKSVTAIHDVVPTLNAELGDRIRRFLGQMKPGAVFERENWGLAAHGENNAHPDRGMPRLESETPLENVFLRVEYQAFLALPEGVGVLFMMRLAVHPVMDVLKEPDVGRDLRRMLESMPEDIAEYKGIARGRRALIRRMDEILG